MILWSLSLSLLHISTSSHFIYLFYQLFFFLLKSFFWFRLLFDLFSRFRFLFFFFLKLLNWFDIIDITRGLPLLIEIVDLMVRKFIAPNRSHSSAWTKDRAKILRFLLLLLFLFLFFPKLFFWCCLSLVNYSLFLHTRFRLGLRLCFFFIS